MIENFSKERMGLVSAEEVKKQHVEIDLAQVEAHKEDALRSEFSELEEKIELGEQDAFEADEAIAKAEKLAESGYLTAKQAQAIKAKAEKKLGKFDGSKQRYNEVGSEIKQRNIKSEVRLVAEKDEIKNKANEAIKAKLEVMQAEIAVVIKSAGLKNKAVEESRLQLLDDKKYKEFRLKIAELSTVPYMPAEFLKRRNDARSKLAITNMLFSDGSSFGTNLEQIINQLSCSQHFHAKVAQEPWIIIHPDVYRKIIIDTRLELGLVDLKDNVDEKKELGEVVYEKLQMVRKDRANLVIDDMLKLEGELPERGRRIRQAGSESPDYESDKRVWEKLYSLLLQKINVAIELQKTLL